MASLRPFFSYYGSKWNAARYYPPPKHSRVAEPFAGGAGYSLFYGCEHVLLIDNDPIVVGVWDFLIKASASDVAALPDMPEVGDSVDSYNMPDEAKWLIGFWLNKGSASPKKTRTEFSTRTDRAQLNWGPKAKARIIQQMPSIRGWQARLGSYDSAPNLDATWFIDPPYTGKGRFYRVGFDDYVALGEWCQRREGQTIVCEGPGASWLPFKELGSFKTTKGRADEFVYITG